MTKKVFYHATYTCDTFTFNRIHFLFVSIECSSGESTSMYLSSNLFFILFLFSKIWCISKTSNLTLNDQFNYFQITIDIECELQSIINYSPFSIGFNEKTRKLQINASEADNNRFKYRDKYSAILVFKNKRTLIESVQDFIIIDNRPICNINLINGIDYYGFLNKNDNSIDLYDTLIIQTCIPTSDIQIYSNASFIKLKHFSGIFD